MNFGFNFDKALKIAADYQNGTGFHCFVINNSGSIISESDEPDICRQCRLLNKKNPVKNRCCDIHLSGIYQAEKFGGKHIYLCPFSLINWSSPIIADGAVKGGLICGPVLTISLMDFVNNEIIWKYLPSKEVVNSIKDDLKSLQKADSSRIQSLSELLFAVTAYLSNMDIKVIEHGKSNEQQSKISSYIQYIKTMECNPQESQKYPIDKERELLGQISKADVKGARKTLNEILGSVFFSSGNDFSIIKSRILELVVLLSRAALKGGADIEQIFGLNYHYLNRIHKFTKIDDLSYWLSTIMTRFIDLVFILKSVKHTDAIFNAVQYVRDNFSEKITLEDIADEISLSPAYFSKIFKEQTGYNFSHYLNKLRIEKSKAFLRNSRIPLIDIAGMVGYEDQSYFTKVFKKFTGNSPGKYRDTRGLIETENYEIHK